MFDGLLRMLGGLFGDVDVRKGEASVHAFYDGAYPNWGKAIVRTTAPSLETVPNGYDEPSAPTASS